jgi:hypothetical protein
MNIGLPKGVLVQQLAGHPSNAFGRTTVFVHQPGLWRYREEVLDKELLEGRKLTHSAPLQRMPGEVYGESGSLRTEAATTSEYFIRGEAPSGPRGSC